MKTKRNCCSCVIACCCCCCCFCLTSDAAFLFCSLTPTVSRLTLASKHSGHMRLVLLSKFFEHFAQMDCRMTERGSEKRLSSSYLTPLIFPSLHPAQTAPGNLLLPPPPPLTAPQDLQWCLRLVKLKLSLQPLHVCFSFSFFLELFWKIYIYFFFLKKRKCVKVFSLFSFCTTGGMSDGSFCFFPLSTTETGCPAS